MRDASPCWCVARPVVQKIDTEKKSCLCPGCLPASKHWRLWLSYDGTNYAGWQLQQGQNTVQAELSGALSKLMGQDVCLTVAGRTDAGVHARGQVVSCRFTSRFTPEKLLRALGSVLPRDISVWRVDEVPEGFSAKTDAVGKNYIYRIYQGLTIDPFIDRFTWHHPRALDVAKMRAAASHLVGDHDYESFRSAACSAAHARRYLWKVDVAKDGPVLEVDIRGNAFCHNMVRIIVGTLADIGVGKFSSDAMLTMLQARDRKLAGKTAPAKGLTLQRVYYPDDLSLAQIPAHATFPRYPVTKERMATCLALASASSY